MFLERFLIYRGGKPEENVSSEASSTKGKERMETNDEKFYKYSKFLLGEIGYSDKQVERIMDDDGKPYGVQIMDIVEAMYRASFGKKPEFVGVWQKGWPNVYVNDLNSESKAAWGTPKGRVLVFKDKDGLLITFKQLDQWQRSVSEKKEMVITKADYADVYDLNDVNDNERFMEENVKSLKSYKIADKIGEEFIEFFYRKFEEFDKSSPYLKNSFEKDYYMRDGLIMRDFDDLDLRQIGRNFEGIKELINKAVYNLLDLDFVKPHLSDFDYYSRLTKVDKSFTDFLLYFENNNFN